MVEFEVYYHNPLRRAGIIKATDLDAAKKVARKRYGGPDIDLFVCRKPKD